MTWATDALGLPADADARAIKRAYAAHLKTTRPDDDPAAFQQLHETYQAALAWAAATACDLEDAVPDGMPAGRRVDVPATLELSDTRHQATRTRPALAECVQDPALEAELERWQDQLHVQDCAMRILTAAQEMSGPDFTAWLDALPELWSLELRPRIAQVIADHLEHHDLHVVDAVLDRLISCFETDEESQVLHALWSACVLDAVQQQSPDFLGHWLSRRAEVWSPYQRLMVGLRVLQALGARRPELNLTTIDTLMQAFDWHRWEGGEDIAWLQAARGKARQQELMLRRQMALSPDGDAAILAYELSVAEWESMTPQWAKALRARLVRAPSQWRSMATALLPARPTWMDRFCGIVQRWFPQQLPDAVHPENLRFWRQIGNPHRPHVRQLVLGLARGLVVAALLAVGAGLLAILSAMHPETAQATWAFRAIAMGLALWSVLVLVQMGARWQARTFIANRSKRIAQRFALPAAAVSIVACTPTGWDAALSAALVYMAMFRVQARTAPPSGFMVIGAAAIAVPLGLIARIPSAGIWPGVVMVLVLWLVSLIQDAQSEHLHSTN